jgi:hypothetical protein
MSRIMTVIQTELTSSTLLTSQVYLSPSLETHNPTFRLYFKALGLLKDIREWSCRRDLDWDVPDKGLDYPTSVPLSEEILSFPSLAPRSTFLYTQTHHWHAPNKKHCNSDPRNIHVLYVPNSTCRPWGTSVRIANFAPHFCHKSSPQK